MEIFLLKFCGRDRTPKGKRPNALKAPNNQFGRILGYWLRGNHLLMESYFGLFFTFTWNVMLLEVVVFAVVGRVVIEGVVLGGVVVRLVVKCHRILLRSSLSWHKFSHFFDRKQTKSKDIRLTLKKQIGIFTPQRHLSHFVLLNFLILNNL